LALGSWLLALNSWLLDLGSWLAAFGNYRPESTARTTVEERPFRACPEPVEGAAKALTSDCGALAPVESMASKENSGTLIVTGASRGIGAAIAILAAERGYSVAVNFATGEVEAEKVAEEILAAGGRAISIQADISHEPDILRLFETAERELGPIKALVNNAGITGGFARVEEVSAKAIDNVFAVNVRGTILCSREAVRRMSTKRGGRGGAIVNISSRAAHTGAAGEWVHYAASKGAVDSFTIGLAREVATEGIRVNAVAPGLVDTGLHAASGEPGRLQRLMGTIPMGRPGTPREVAEGVLWLLSPAASYTTGAILEIGGGR
jgi:NAD(P)-dependent dehydrogenase (short-subunit alcohol dehydrogenase family)